MSEDIKFVNGHPCPHCDSLVYGPTITCGVCGGALDMSDSIRVDAGIITKKRTIEGQVWVCTIEQGVIRHLFKAGKIDLSPFDRSSFVAKKMAELLGARL